MVKQVQHSNYNRNKRGSLRETEDFLKGCVTLHSNVSRWKVSSRKNRKSIFGESSLLKPWCLTKTPWQHYNSGYLLKLKIKLRSFSDLETSTGCFLEMVRPMYILSRFSWEGMSVSAPPCGLQLVEYHPTVPRSSSTYSMSNCRQNQRRNAEF